MATCSGAPPSRSIARSTTQRASRAASSWAVCGSPASSSGVLSPMRRLNSLATPSGAASARRSAASPNSTALSGPKNNTELTAAALEPSGSTSTFPQSPASRRQIAAAVNVVPRSTPST
jgi:hypothetical protein